MEDDYSFYPDEADDEPRDGTQLFVLFFFLLF